MPRYAAIRRVMLMTVLSAASLLPATILATPANMPTFSATYSVRYGILRGTMALELERDSSGYIYRTSLRPRGVASWLRRGEIRETTELAMMDGQFRPLNYESNDTIANPARWARYEFDYADGRVTGEYKQRAVNEPMRSAGHNRISAQVAIMLALQSKSALSEYWIFDRARWRAFHFEVIPKQRAKTPSGNFDTVEVRYARADDSKSWSLQCAPELNYLPVMIEFREGGKIKSRAVLTDYRIEHQDDLMHATSKEITSRPGPGNQAQ